jgi:hypothetical protein
MVAGFYAAVAAVADAGNNVVVDTLMGDPFDASECASRLRHLDVLMVGVHCPLAVLEEREKARGDRPHGLARGELSRVHLYASYDLEIDSSERSPQDCARAIVQASATHARHDAIERMYLGSLRLPWDERQTTTLILEPLSSDSNGRGRFCRRGS